MDDTVQMTVPAAGMLASSFSARPLGAASSSSDWDPPKFASAGLSLVGGSKDSAMEVMFSMEHLRGEGVCRPEVTCGREIESLREGAS